MSMLSTVWSYIKRKEDGSSYGNRGLRDNPASLRALFADEFAMQDIAAIQSLCRHRATKRERALQE